MGVENTEDKANAVSGDDPQALLAGTASVLTPQSGELPSSNPPAIGSIIAQDNVIISAQYLNIDGTVQSGIADYNLDLPSSLDSIIAADQTQYNDNVATNPATPSLFPLNTGPSPTSDPQGYANWLLTGSNSNNPTSATGNVQADYNAHTQRIEVDAVDVQGGFMELEGNILSTGNGHINVMDGYGQINVTNDTASNIAVNDLDAGGNGIAGKLVIVDTNYSPPETTTYTTLNGTVSSTTTKSVTSQATAAVTQTNGILSIAATGSPFTITGGDGKTNLLGSSPSTGQTITGSAAAGLDHQFDERYAGHVRQRQSIYDNLDACRLRERHCPGHGAAEPNQRRFPQRLLANDL